MLKKYFIFFLLIFSLNVFGEELLSKPTTRLVDNSSVLSAIQFNELNQKLNNIYENESNTEIEVLILPKITNGLDLFDFSTSIFNSWKLGDKKLNNGVLMVILTDTSQIRITTGSGLEGALPDSYLGRIFDENNIKEKLKSKDYYNAINISIESMNQKIVLENFGAHKNRLNISFPMIIVIIVIVVILIICSFIPCGDSVLSFYIVYYLFQILFQILIMFISGGKIGGGGGSSGGGSSR